MSPGAMPDGSGGAEEAEAGEAPAVMDPELRARAQRRRLQGLAGATVHGNDGKTVGRVRDVYLRDATGELAAIAVMPRQLSARSVLIPAAAIAALPGTLEEPADQHPSAAEAPEPGADDILHLRVDAATAKAGTPPPLTLHATPEDLQEAAAALRLEDGPAGA